MRCIALGLGLLAAVPALAADWPLFRGNPAMSGTAEIQLPDKLEERWTFKTGNAIEGAPAVVNGVVYIASADKHMYAVDLKTGMQKWKTSLGTPIKASPAIRGDRLYIGDADGKFHALALDTGKILWTFETFGEIKSGANFHNDNILFGSLDATLYCLSPEGKKLWEYKTEGEVHGSPAIVGDRTFLAGCDSIMHVLDAKTGQQLGSVELGGQTGATAAVYGEGIYVGTMSNQVVGMNWKEPKLLWSFEAPRRQQPFYASPAITQDLVVIGSRDRKVYAIDRKTGKEVWNFITDGSVDASPVIAGGKVYVGSISDLGSFYVLDLKTGAQREVLQLDSAILGSAALGPDCLLIGTDRGTLYCLGSKPSE